MPREKRPSLFQRVVKTRRVDDWVKRRKDEKQKKKNRKLIDDFVQKIGKKGGGALSLDKDGVCAFPYKKYVIVIEVAEYSTDICQFRTTVCPLGPRSNEKQVIKTAFTLQDEDPEAVQEAIAMKQAHDGSLTRLTVPIQIESPGKAFLDIVLDGVHMNWDVPIKGLKFDVMARCLDEFLTTTVEMNKKFQIAKTAPRMPEEPKMEETKGGIFPKLLKCG